MGKEQLETRCNWTFTVRDAATGEVKRVRKYRNKLPAAGINAIMQHLALSSPTPASLIVTHVALGTGSTAAADGDTTLDTESYRNELASGAQASKKAYLSGFFTATECDGTYAEAGLFINGTAAADSGTLLSRVLIDITKSNTETLTIDVEIEGSSVT